jgi:hypothetical protein
MRPTVTNYSLFDFFRLQYNESILLEPALRVLGYIAIGNIERIEVQKQKP